MEPVTEVRVAPVVLIILETTPIRVKPILFRGSELPMGTAPCVDTAVRCVPVESDVSFIGIVMEPTKMRTPRIFLFAMLVAVVTISGCKMPSFQILKKRNCNLGNGRLFKFRDVGFKHHRLCPFKRFRSPQQPAYEPFVCESCLQDAPDLFDGTCESCSQNGFHDSSFDQNRLLPSYAQPYDQPQFQDSVQPDIQAPRDLRLLAPRELPLQAPAESLDIFRSTPAPATAPEPLTAPELLNESTNIRGSVLPRVPTLRSKPQIDGVMQRAEKARQQRLAAETEAKAMAKEAEPKVATTLPPVKPKVVEEFLPRVKNLADATESTVQQFVKPEDQDDNDFVVPTEIEEKATEIVSEPTPIKMPEVAKLEPIVEVKPLRSEKEVVDELRNSTVPHAVVFDSSPIIPEQRIQKTIPTKPKVNDQVVLRARPVQSFQFDSNPTTTIVESTRIAPPPTLQATTLRPSNYYDHSRVAEQTSPPTSTVVNSRVENRNSVPAVQASMKRRVLVADVLEKPKFTIEPLPQQREVLISPEGVPLDQISREPALFRSLPVSEQMTEPSSIYLENLPLPQQSEVLMSPEGVPLDQISREPTQFRSLPVSDQMTEPASGYLENSTTERVRPQAQPEAQLKMQAELQPERSVHQSAPRTPAILRLRAAPTGDSSGFSNASSAARIKMLQPSYQYNREQRGEGQQGTSDSEEAPVFRLPQQQGQPMFDYDRIKEEIDRMSKQSRPSDVLDR